MKISSKISIIASLATLSLVGTGFAAWQFNAIASKSLASNVAITKDTSIGTIALDPETSYLTLDQNNLCFTSVNYSNSEEAVDANDIITFVEVLYEGGSSNDTSYKWSSCSWFCILNDGIGDLPRKRGTIND